MSTLLQVLSEPGVEETLDELMKSSEAAFERNHLESVPKVIRRRYPQNVAGSGAERPVAS